MRIVFCFILLFNVCWCDEEDHGSDHVLGGSLNDNQDSNYQKEENDSIIRPCSLHDTNCIRHFFAHNFQCFPTEGPVSDPYVLKEPLYLPIPQANLTYILNNAEFRGLNKWKIGEFFVNKVTQTLVLEVVFDSIVVACPHADLIYHRKGKEPLQASDSTIIDYKNLSFTLTVSYGKDTRAWNSHVYTYVPDANPKYTIGPATYASKDPGFMEALIDLEQKVQVTLKELFVSQGPLLFSLFFENSICNFQHY